MKQVLQNLRRGTTSVTDVVAPGVSAGRVLIQTDASLISAGTERMLVDFSQASLVGKVRAQPEKVRQVLDKIRTDGLLPTMEAVFDRLDEPLPLGYCNAGTVLEVGAGVTGIVPGDRVVSNAPHAEIVSVPRLLCAKTPDDVTDEQASFTVLASIGLQGVRLAEPQFGEAVVVVGMGLIGLVTAQLLLSSGCRVLATDVNPQRLAMAQQFGCEAVNVAEGGDPIAAAQAFTGGKGVDAVLITAAAKGDEIVHEAAQMCRKRGRIVLVGVVDLNLRRSDFYEKELTFQVSCSYGPGRYDDAYEQRGQDYPFGFVRWTEQRNFEAILEALRSRRLIVENLITDRFPLDDAAQAYAKVQSDGNCLGVVLQYPEKTPVNRTLRLRSQPGSRAARQAVLGIIGAGNFARMTMVPALGKTTARLKYIAGRSNGAAVHHLASKFGVEIATTDHRRVLEDDEVNAVLISTRHDAHARLACEALAAGKHVFVEKPLAMNADQVQQILETARRHPDRQLMVGFNRRFSPHVQWMKELLAERSEPLAMNFTANAGYLPADLWVHDPVRGGGRIIGEACHFIDLMVYLTGSEIRSVAAHQMGEGVAVKEDKMAISLGFDDGSVGTVNYFANGSKSYPKEQMQIFSDHRTLQMENFRRTAAFGFRGSRRFRTRRQDKGHRRQFAAFVERVAAGGEPLIPLAQLVNVTLASFAAVEAARAGRTIHLRDEYREVGRSEAVCESDDQHRIAIEVSQ